MTAPEGTTVAICLEPLDVLFFRDGRPFGALDSLHQIGAETIDVIRFHSASDATTRFGTGYPAGIIEVITRR